MASLAAKTLGKSLLKSPVARDFAKDVAIGTATQYLEGGPAPPPMSTSAFSGLAIMRWLVLAAISLVYLYIAIYLTGAMSGTCAFGIFGLLLMRDFIVSYFGLSLIPSI